MANTASARDTSGRNGIDRRRRIHGHGDGDSAIRLGVAIERPFAHVPLDGFYLTSDDARLRFLRLPRPSEDEVYEVAFRTAEKVNGNSSSY